MGESLGLIEVSGLTTAIVVADTMAKTANIKILDIENTKGLGYITIKVCGDVGAVNAAVESGKQIAIENNALVSVKVIPRCSKDVESTFYPREEKKDDLTKESEKEKNIENTPLENLKETSHKQEKNIKKVIKNNIDDKVIDKNLEIDNSKPKEKKARKNSKKAETKKE